MGQGPLPGQIQSISMNIITQQQPKTKLSLV